MSKYKLSEIIVYPVKSLGGFSVDSAEVTDRGLKYDRRWMLVDENNQFLTQRKFHKMALLQTKITNNSLVVFNKTNPADKIEVELNPAIDQIEKAIVWDDTVDVFTYSDAINNWFSEQLNTNCRLVYMPDESKRVVDPEYAKQNELTSLADGYPFLIIGEESLKLLNSKLDTPLPMNRFRPNLVSTGGEPHEEDTWEQFKINDIIFKPVKPCARCVVTTVDQSTGEKGTEPLKTLAAYRQTDNNKVNFGMNLLHEGKGIVSVGEELSII